MADDIKNFIKKNTEGVNAGGGFLKSAEAVRRIEKEIKNGTLTMGQAHIASIEANVENSYKRDDDIKLGSADIRALEFSQDIKGNKSARTIVRDTLRYHDVTAARLRDQRPNGLMSDNSHDTILDSIGQALNKSSALQAVKREDIFKGSHFPNEKASFANYAWKSKHPPQEESEGLRDYPDSVAAEDNATLQRNIDEKGLVLERPQGSSLHHAIDELSTRGLPEETRRFLTEHFQSFVIEHDWAGAFDKATDFDKGEVRLPFQFTAFEFRISGQRIIVSLGETDTHGIRGVLMVGINRRWYVSSANLTFKDGRLEDLLGVGEHHMGTPLLELLTRQIRAVCIVLDAEVAEKTTVRVSEKLARHCAKTGKTPMKDYHIVSLAKRHKVKPPETSEPSDRRRPRLHFRRGHWRHFPDHRTWIEWMLVGDPDLGFIDKHYRL